MIVLLLFPKSNLKEANSMSVRVQLELSDEEDKIVEVYRLEHNKKTNEEAIREIIKQHKDLHAFKEKNKKNWLQSMTQ
jgi:hypothetical protein